MVIGNQCFNSSRVLGEGAAATAFAKERSYPVLVAVVVAVTTNSSSPLLLCIELRLLPELSISGRINTVLVCGGNMEQ